MTENNDHGHELGPSTEDNKTLFVRKLAPTVDETELEEVFSEIGPVQRAFLIRDKKSGDSKEFGFVQFALEDDALQALQSLQNKSLKGKKIQISRAKEPGKKHSEQNSIPDGEAESNYLDTVVTEKGKSVSLKKPQANEKAVVSPEQEKLRRTTIVFGLSEHLDKKIIRKKFRKLGNIQEFDWPVKTFGETAESKSVARIVYKNREECLTATKKIDKHQLHGYTMKARHGDDVFTFNEGKGKTRLIIRNLPFQTKESDIIKKFSSFGPLTDVKIAKQPSSSNEPSSKVASSSRGFGFVQFSTKVDAARALQKMNEMKMGKRTVAVDWARSKKHYEVLLKQLAKEKQRAENEETTMENTGNTGVEASDNAKSASNKGEQLLENDQSSQLDEDDDESQNQQPEMNDNEFQGDNDSQRSGRSDIDASEGSQTLKSHSVHQSSEAESKLSGNPAPTKENKEDVHEGKTLFVRNIPFDATEDDLHRAFRRFGKLRYARLVMDRSSGLSKGSGFVQFFERENADEALKAANHGLFPPEDGETTYSSPQSALPDADVVPFSGEAKLKNKNTDEHHIPASVKAALGSEGSGGIQLKERPLLVTRAIDKTKAKQLTKNSEALKKKFDRRHLYLAKEGNIGGETAAAENMPRADLSRREEAARDKNKKLKNPLFFVSPYRLSIRNLDKSVDDKALKKLVLDAAKQGLKQGLVIASEGDPTLWPPPGTKVSKMVPIVEKCKVMRDNPRKEGERMRFEADGVTPKSKGFAFVEFREHFHALAALRMLNNNPQYSDYSVGGAFTMKSPEKSRPRLIVEFTIENAAKVKLQEKRAERKKRLREEKKNEAEELENEDPEEEKKENQAQEQGNFPEEGNLGEEILVSDENHEKDFHESDEESLSGLEFDEEGKVYKGNLDDSDIEYEMGEESDGVDEEGKIGGFMVPQWLVKPSKDNSRSKPRGEPSHEDAQSRAVHQAVQSARKTQGKTKGANKNSGKRARDPAQTISGKKKKKKKV